MGVIALSAPAGESGVDRRRGEFVCGLGWHAFPGEDRLDPGRVSVL